MTTVGFIGLGTMGKRMAGHMLDRLPEGDTLVLNDLSADRVKDLLDAGAVWADSAKELAGKADVVFFMVPDVPQVKSVLAGDNGLLAGISKEILLVVCSTVSPDAVRQLDVEVQSSTKGLARVIDAPVSGGEVGAVAGTLSIMVGGPDDLVAKALPYLKLTGNPAHLGPTGAGEVAKACNQLIGAASIVANAEAAVVAERAGLDVQKLFDLMLGGYSTSKIMADKAPRYINKDYTVSGAASFWIKDLKAYLDEANRTGTPTVQGDRLLDAFQGVVDAGWGAEDTAIVQKFIEERPEEN
ncbi:NAD(P)-dependent oxidoreductase [Propionimicrobium sp. PCR01-08-3]|uniref:NAD(P)-dependent oxidoreductase n=1 Tax=Propionimicrobium sp. PCR01-08-3 TaxID=3052086 RepID=UPI00255CB4D0|nr:NAD(P)-dependent oxidoreductase [Propionimicrobium sp. PCR01-08-3]WIY83631.1 NAD(P)-dependent oxidoreductase [Propionimicrobium sp. PCR01-08-3]